MIFDLGLRDGRKLAMKGYACLQNQFFLKTPDVYFIRLFELPTFYTWFSYYKITFVNLQQAYIIIYFVPMVLKISDKYKSDSDVDFN